MRIPGRRSPQTIGPSDPAPQATGNKTHSRKHKRRIAAALCRPIPQYPPIAPLPSPHTNARLQENETISRPEGTTMITPTIRLGKGFPSPDDTSPHSDPRLLILLPDEPYDIQRSRPKLWFPCDPQNCTFHPPPEPLPLQEVAASPRWKAKNSLF